MKDPYDIWAFVTRSSGQPAEVARYCGVDPQDEAFKSLMRSMVTSGFLRNGFAVWLPGNQPPPGPLRPLHDGEQPPEDLRERLPPSGVPIADALPAPAAPAGQPGTGEQEKPLPDGLRRGPDGQAEVADDLVDRVAKADVVPAVGQLAVQAKWMRQMIEDDDWGDDEPADVLERLLDLVDKTAADVGYGTIGERGALVPYDPALHEYRGDLPPGGMSRTVVVTDLGQTWAHRGRVMVIQKATVDLYDEDMGQLHISKISGLDNEFDDPRVLLWFNDAAPVKPQTYADEDWYRCTRVVQSGEVYDDCKFSGCQAFGAGSRCGSEEADPDCEGEECFTAVCIHPKDDKGRCDVMLVLIQGDEDYITIPQDQLITSCPAED